MHWTDSFNNSYPFCKIISDSLYEWVIESFTELIHLTTLFSSGKKKWLFISKTVTICDMTSTLLPRWYRIHTKKKCLVSAGFFLFPFGSTRFSSSILVMPVMKVTHLICVMEPTRQEACGSICKAFIQGHGQKNKQGSCNGKQLQHRQDKGLIQETRAILKTRENRQGKTMITKWAP